MYSVAGVRDLKGMHVESKGNALSGRYKVITDRSQGESGVLFWSHPMIAKCILPYIHLFFHW